MIQNLDPSNRQKVVYFYAEMDGEILGHNKTQPILLLMQVACIDEPIQIALKEPRKTAFQRFPK